MDGKEFLSTARLLLAQGKSESDFRSAISRAYYACFLTVRKIIFDNRNPSICFSIHEEGDIGHDKLRQYLNKSDDQNILRLRQDLYDLRKARNEADYNMEKSYTVSKDDANKIIIEASDFLSNILGVDPKKFGESINKQFEIETNKN